MAWSNLQNVQGNHETPYLVLNIMQWAIEYCVIMLSHPLSHHSIIILCGKLWLIVYYFYMNLLLFIYHSQPITLELWHKGLWSFFSWVPCWLYHNHNNERKNSFTFLIPMHYCYYEIICAIFLNILFTWILVHFLSLIILFINYVSLWYLLHTSSLLIILF